MREQVRIRYVHLVPIHTIVLDWTKCTKWVNRSARNLQSGKLTVFCCIEIEQRENALNIGNLSKVLHQDNLLYYIIGKIPITYLHFTYYRARNSVCIPIKLLCTEFGTFTTGNKTEKHFQIRAIFWKCLKRSIST